MQRSVGGGKMGGKMGGEEREGGRGYDGRACHLTLLAAAYPRGSFFYLVGNPGV